MISNHISQNKCALCIALMKKKKNCNQKLHGALT